MSTSQLTKTLLTGSMIMTLAATCANADSGRGRHKQFYVVPAPHSTGSGQGGAVTIDGRLDDWDLSGQIEMFVIEATRNTQSAKIAAMYDEEALYLSGEIADSTPMMNRHDPRVNPGRAWDADAVQFRITLDPEADYPVRESAFDYRARRGQPPPKVDTRDDIVHMLLWHYTDEGTAHLQMHKGMSYRIPDPAWQPDGLVPADKFEGAYRKWEAGDGYTFEYRIPWSTLGADRPLRGGDKVAGTVNVLWSRPDGLAHIRVSGAAYDIMGEPGFAFQNAACWGRVIFSEAGNVPQEWVRTGLPPERELPLEFAFDLPRDGETTVQLFTPEGRAARILVAQEARRAGRQTVSWNGLDDHGKPLPPGDYHWRGIVHDPVKAEFRFSVHNSGQPPYTTTDGTGGWGADHGTPQDAVALADGMLLVWDAAEYGSGAIRVDLEGRKLWGTQSGATHIATDGTLYYTVGDRGFHRGLNVSIFEVENARPARLPGGTAHFAPPPNGSDETNRASGLAWHDGILYVSYLDRDLIAAFSTETGALAGLLAVPAPERLAVTPAGALLVVSEGKVTSYQVSVISGKISGNGKLITDDSTTDHRLLITDHLDDPQGVAVGPDGTIYVANRGALQNVGVFAADGNYLRSIGKAGGRPAVGAYDPSGMLAPGGLALDARGRLWVAETLDGPKRIGIWDADSGANLDEFFGAAGYFSYGFIDPDRPDEIYAHHMLWDIDWKNDTTQPKSTVWRKTSPDMVPPPGPYAYQNIPRMVTGANGSQYMWGNTVPLSILLRRDGDRFKPFAALLDINSTTGIALVDNDQETWPRDRRIPRTLLWQDANDDQIVQREELTLLPDREYARARFAWVEKDLTVRLSSGHVWRPADVGAAGQPVFNPETAEKAVAGGQTGYMAPLPDGSVLSLRHHHTREAPLEGPSLIRHSPTGEMLWHYPDLIAWRHSLNLPVVRAGRLWSMTGLMGVAGDFFAHQTYFGVNQIFRVDGQYVGAILNDRRVEGRGPYAGQSEGQGGSFVRLNIAGIERTFAIGGSNDVRVWEVHGLDTIQNLPGGMYRHTAEAVALARAADDAYRAALAGERQLRIVAGGKEAMMRATSPAAARRVEGTRGFEVRAAYDDTALHIRFDVVSSHELVNAVADSRILFRGGNLLDIQLATDPDADPARNTPAPGDMRLLITRRNRRPLAVLFRPRIAGFDGERQVLTSPTGQEAFDGIDVVEAVKLDYARTDAGFTATVTIPHSLTGLRIAPGDTLKLDLGYVFGNADGTQSAIRAYLFNDSFSANVVDDIPHESRLEPAEWGEVTVE